MLFLAAGLVGCAESQETTASAPFSCIPDGYGVVGGSAVQASQAEAKKVVMIMGLGANGQKSICTGSLVDSRHVLTAAHCVEPYQSSDVYVVFHHDLLCSSGVDVEQDAVQAKRLHIHEGYNGSQDIPVNDVALIEIPPNSRMDYPVQILHNGNGTVSSDVVQALGYGKTSEYNLDSGKLREVTKSFSQDIKVLEDLIVMMQPTAGVCQGDSGGPLMAQIDGAEKIMGVLSAVGGDDKSTVCHGLSFYSYVPHYLPWIEAILKSK